MEGIYLVIGLIVVIGGGGGLYLLNERKWRRTFEELKKDPAAQTMWLGMQNQVEQLRAQMTDGLNKNISLLTEQQRAVNEQLRGITEQVNRQLTSSSGEIGKRLDNAARVIGDVQKSIGALSEASKQIFEVGKNIASLQEILQPPKLRGGLGELFLGELLAQILPPKFFTLQYMFASGERVDAAVRLGDKIVPIDSKFPLENFKRIMDCKTDEERKTSQKSFTRDVKKHIDDIASKYILPNEGTYDFALLYIPAENVYYETITKDDSFGEEKGILNYALKKRVIPVSPNLFFAYLQVIVLGLKGLQIEKDAEKILILLTTLRRELGSFQEDFQLVGKHLTNAVNKYAEAGRRLEKFHFRLDQIGGTPEPSLIDEKIDGKIEIKNGN